jgi:hypothetical protein
MRETLSNMHKLTKVVSQQAVPGEPGLQMKGLRTINTNMG